MSLVSWALDEFFVGRVCIHRPQALHALNTQVFYDLQMVLAKAAASDAHVVIVQSEGEKAFVAGADLKEMAGFSPAQAQRFAQLGQQTFRALEQLPQITIAQIQGFALGGGLELALSCDILVASDLAKFSFPEVALGLIPGFAGTQRISRKIGKARALEWVCSAQRYTATQAFSVGLVEHVVAPAELASFVTQLALSISKHPPRAVQMAKKSIALGAETDFVTGCAVENSLFGLRFADPEATEGMGKFLSK